MFDSLRSAAVKQSLWLIPLCLFPAAAISSASLWIDEGITVYLASQSSVQGMFREILLSNSSEIQMPGYMVYMWGWINVFGATEMALRASNLPFLGLFLFFILLLPRSNVFKLISILLVCFNPLVVHSLNEARSTTALFALSGVSVCGLIMFCHGSPEQARLGKAALWISVAVGACFNLLALFVIPAIAAVLFVHDRVARSWRAAFHELARPALMMGLALLPLVVYYAWTFARGNGGIRERPSVLNLAFVLYEFAGFGGVGPPRNEVRHSLSILTSGQYLVPMLILGVILMVVGVVILAGRRRKGYSPDALETSFLPGFVVGVVVLSLVSYIVSFRFLGRHFIFLYPLLIFFVSGVLSTTLGAAGGRPKVVVALLVCLAGSWLYADFNLRCVAAYQKEDYRLAVRSAAISGERGSAILWAGSEFAAAYYGLDFPGLRCPESWKAIRSARIASNLSESEIDAVVRENPGAILVIFSKPDLFDRLGAWRSYVARRQPRALVCRPDFSVFAL